MRTKELFKENAYLKSCYSKITDIDKHWVILDQTIFYAEGGGQLGDIGNFVIEDSQYKVKNTTRENNIIKHLLEDTTGLKVNDEVQCLINWDRRYRLMQIHTCLHLLCSIIKAPVTGGSVGDGRGRLDFNLINKPEKDFITKSLQNLIDQNFEVSASWITNRELEENPNLVRTMSVTPPKGDGNIRMIKIGSDIDYQPCGGTHVKKTSDIGTISVDKIENKGKQNKRIIISLD